MKYATSIFTLATCFIFCSCSNDATQENDSEVPQELELAYWNDTDVKESILEFIENVTDENNSAYLTPEERIAVFDLDGTIICEKPEYSEVAVSEEYMRRQLKRNPELANSQPYKALVEGDEQYLTDSVDQVLLTPFIGYSQEQYTDSVISFFNSTKHPKFDVYYKDLFYAPMIELIELLEANEFTVYISSYSQQSLIRSIAKEYLGINHEHSIGSVVDVDLTEDNSELVRDDNFILKNQYKAEVWEYQVGITPTLVVGNSGGDLEILEYTNTLNPHKIIIVNHDDSIREYQYVSQDLLNVAKENSWDIISMKDDFKVVFE